MWVERGYFAFGWTARLLVAAVAAGLAGFLIPNLAPIAISWVLFQLMGFVAPKTRFVGRIAITLLTVAVLIPDALYPGAAKLTVYRAVLSCMLWHSLGIFMDVLEVPRPEDWRERKTAVSEAQVLY